MLPAEGSLKRFRKEGWRSFGKKFVNPLLYIFRVRAVTEFETLKCLLDLAEFVNKGLRSGTKAYVWTFL